MAITTDRGRDVSYEINNAIRKTLYDGCKQLQGDQYKSQCVQYYFGKSAYRDWTNSKVLLPAINHVIRDEFYGMLDGIKYVQDGYKLTGAEINKIHSGMKEYVITQLE